MGSGSLRPEDLAGPNRSVKPCAAPTEAVGEPPRAGAALLAAAGLLAPFLITGLAGTWAGAATGSLVGALDEALAAALGTDLGAAAAFTAGLGAALAGGLPRKADDALAAGLAEVLAAGLTAALGGDLRGALPADFAVGLASGLAEALAAVLTGLIEVLGADLPEGFAEALAAGLAVVLTADLDAVAGRELGRAGDLAGPAGLERDLAADELTVTTPRKLDKGPRSDPLGARGL